MNAANHPDHLHFDELMKRALAASAANDADAALRLFGEASNAEPTSGLPHFLRASELAQLGRMEEAETAFANAVILAPELHIARYQLGLLQFTSARAAVALVTWQPLLDLPDSDPLHSFVQGFAALAADDFNDARHWFKRGITDNVSNAPLNHDVQLVLAELDKLLDVAPAQHDDSGTPAHVLISNYERHGSLH
jgi:tetratricopeptide (TPR) repeat protein